MLLALVLASSSFVIDGGDATAPAYNFARVQAVVSAPTAPEPPAQDPPPPVVPSPDKDLRVSIVAGASNSSASGSTTQGSVKPFVDLVATFPFTVGKGADAHAPFLVQLEGVFSGSPGANISLSDITTFDAVSFNSGLHWAFGDSGTAWTTVSVSGGVTSRLSSQAVTKNPGHGELCVGMFKKDHSASFNFCPVGFSTETGDAATVGRADGRVTIQKALRLQVSVIVPYANAPSNYAIPNTVHSTVALVAIGADLDHIFAKTP